MIITHSIKVCHLQHLTMVKVTILAKNQLFQNMVMLHIKIKGIKRRTTYMHTFDLTHILDARGGVKRSKQLSFSVSGHISYKGISN